MVFYAGITKQIFITSIAGDRIGGAKFITEDRERPFTLPENGQDPQATGETDLTIYARGTPIPEIFPVRGVKQVFEYGQ